MTSNPITALACAAVLLACRAVENSAAEPSGEPPSEPKGEAALCEVLAGMGVRYLPGEGRVEVSGWVNMQTGPVEVFACAPEGKTHESVLVLDCLPSGLHAGLLALGLEPGTPAAIGRDGAFERPTGDRVEIRVRWKDAGGAQRTARAEEWIWDQKAQAPMQSAAWIFAGSFVQESGADAASSSYAANHVKSLVTTYYDASSIIENPWEDDFDDTAYCSNERAVPPVGTPVTVHFTPQS